MCGDLKVLHGWFPTSLCSVSQTVVCKSPPVPEVDKLLTFISFWDLLAGMCSDNRSLRRLLSAPPPSLWVLKGSPPPFGDVGLFRFPSVVLLLSKLVSSTSRPEHGFAALPFP